MTKLAIAFIDHPFHRKTRSSSFFVELLEKQFDVHVFYVDKDPRAVMKEIADAGYSCAICWQTEFCAPYFLMRGMRVVCIPMYDGVADAPSWYWSAMRQARFINFSETLHRRVKALGIESYHFRYFGGSRNSTPQARFADLRAFFWQRRPEEGLCYKFAHHLIGGVTSSLHVHNAPDTEPADDWRPGGLCTVSAFSDNGSTYREALEHANIFVCSRFSEGIGLSMLEAMSRGMCVIAHNEPTASEYILDRSNGLLIDYRTATPFRRTGEDALDCARAEAIAKMARDTYLRGSEDWGRTIDQLPFLIKSAPAADLSQREKGFSQNYLDITRYARIDFPHYLHLLLKLHRRGLIGEEDAATRLRDHWKRQMQRFPGVGLAWRASRITWRSFQKLVRL